MLLPRIVYGPHFIFHGQCFGTSAMAAATENIRCLPLSFAVRAAVITVWLSRTFATGMSAFFSIFFHGYTFCTLERQIRLNVSKRFASVARSGKDAGGPVAE